MRARARIVLVLIALSASFGLAGCAAIEDLKEAFLRWLELGKLPSGGRGPFVLPDPTPIIPAEKPEKKGGKQAVKASQVSAQPAPPAARRGAPSKETADPGLPRGGEAGRRAIRAVPARAAAVAYKRTIIGNGRGGSEHILHNGAARQQQAV